MALSTMDDVVWVLVVKGNLAHRIDCLGVEKEQGSLSATQRVLRDAAKSQGVGSDPPERLEWANKAFVYVTDEHALEIQNVLRNNGIKLQSKHIVVSDRFLPAVIEALNAEPTGTTREMFQKRRAGDVSGMQKFRAPPRRRCVGPVDRLEQEHGE